MGASMLSWINFPSFMLTAMALGAGQISGLFAREGGGRIQVYKSEEELGHAQEDGPAVCLALGITLWSGELQEDKWGSDEGKLCSLGSVPHNNTLFNFSKRQFRRAYAAASYVIQQPVSDIALDYSWCSSTSR